MKEFIAKYQKAIVGTGAVAVLVVCYFQQKELSKLRIEQIKIDVRIAVARVMNVEPMSPRAIEHKSLHNRDYFQAVVRETHLRLLPRAQEQQRGPREQPLTSGELLKLWFFLERVPVTLWRV